MSSLSALFLRFVTKANIVSKQKNIVTHLNNFAKFSSVSNDITADTLTADETTNIIKKDEVSFARMLRLSALIQMGDPEGAIVKGVIVEIMNDNLYIDFGAKFMAVCRKPRYKTEFVFSNTLLRFKFVH